MVDINIKSKNKQAPAWLLVFLGAMLGFILISLAWEFYEHKADIKYYDCMENYAEEIYCNDTGIDSFWVKYSLVLCTPEPPTLDYIPALEPMEPIVMDDIYIGICWNRSGSLWKQIFKE